jgi:DNA-binding NarL/FixJ family response regulator
LNSTTMKKTTILIVDDHLLIRQTWSFILNSRFDYQVIGDCCNAQEAIKLAGSLFPDIILLDINLKEMNGMDAVPLLLKASPASKILGLSMYDHPAYAGRMIRDGAMGYLTKCSSVSEMFKALKEISCGRKYLCHKIKDIIAGQVMNSEEERTVIPLSKRQLEIIEYIKQGLSSKEIAAKLCLAVKTVDVHRYNILKKLGLSNRAALVNFTGINSVGFFEYSK